MIYIFAVLTLAFIGSYIWAMIWIFRDVETRYGKIWGRIFLILMLSIGILTILLVFFSLKWLLIFYILSSIGS